MQKSRFSEEEIAKILQGQEDGLKVCDIRGQHRISEQSLCRWKARYGGMTLSEVKPLKALDGKTVGPSNCLRNTQWTFNP